MKKRMFSLAMALCLACSLAVPVCAADISDGPISDGDIIDTTPAHPFLPSPGPNEPNWSSESGSTHQFITANAITMVKNSYPSYPLNSYTATLKSFSDYPDKKESGQTDGIYFSGHFYNPDTRLTWTDEFAIRPKQDATAKDRLVWWYTESVKRYKAGNKASAMEALGCALHYAADLSTPHHAANMTVPISNHAEFENAVRVTQNKYITTYTTANTFTWAKQTAIDDMGHNFAVYAKSWYLTANDLSKTATAAENTLPKAQRNCAAVIYKFLVDVGAF